MVDLEITMSLIGSSTSILILQILRRGHEHHSGRQMAESLIWDKQKLLDSIVTGK